MILSLIIWIIFGLYALGAIVFFLTAKIEFERPHWYDRYLAAVIWLPLIIYVLRAVRRGDAVLTRRKE